MYVNKFKIGILLLLFIVLINISIPVQASLIDEILSTGNDFLQRGKNAGSTFDGNNMKLTLDELYNLFLLAGIIIAVVVGAFLGIKFMVESVEGKAKIKEALIPFCLGCMVIFGGFAIWKFGMKLFSEVEQAEKQSISVQQYLDSRCTAEKHSFTNFADKTCNNCNQECDHRMSAPNASGIKKCLNQHCGFEIVLCTSTYPGNTSKPHSYKDGVCQVCGYICNHNYPCEGLDNQNHVCSECKENPKSHIFQAQKVVCSICNYRCEHHYVLSDGIVRCARGCNYAHDNCAKGSNRKCSYTVTNFSTNQIMCSECYAPKPCAELGKECEPLNGLPGICKQCGKKIK